MFSGLLNKLKTAGMNWLGLGKNKSQSGLINKAKDFVGGLNNFITSKGVKNTVNSVGSFIPQIKDYYNSSKKYINMADQFINQQGLAKKIDRVVKKPPPSLERMKPDKNTDYLGEYDTGNLGALGF